MLGCKHVEVSYECERLTPGITRRPERLYWRAIVSAVGCIGLFGRDAVSMQRGAHNDHDRPAAYQPGELNHAPPVNRNRFLS